MYNNLSHLQEKWAPLLNYDGFETFKDSHRRFVTAVLLENQEKALREEQAFSSGMLFESPTTFANAVGSGGGFGGSATASGPVAGFDPVMISLIRRSMPNLIAYDLCGVPVITIRVVLKHSLTKLIAPSLVKIVALILLVVLPMLTLVWVRPMVQTLVLILVC
jgi:hypothetical protein